MTCWSPDFSYVEIKSLIKWEETWSDIQDNIDSDEGDPRNTLSEYNEILPEVVDILRDYGSDFSFYRINVSEDTMWVHVGVVGEVADMIEVDIDLPEVDLLEEAKDKICESTWTDLPKLILDAERIDRLWKRMVELRDTHEDPPRFLRIICKCLAVERELCILRREALTHPWSKVQEQFSFGKPSIPPVSVSR